MSERRKTPRVVVRPETAVLTRGFDPALSVGSARPAVFRSSTYVFSSPEAAERAFGAVQRFRIALRMHDDLGQQRVEARIGAVAGVAVVIHPHAAAGPEGTHAT